MRKLNKNIIILGVMMLGLIAIDFFAPEPIDWNPYLSKEVKSPYGCYIFYNLLQDYFPEKKIHTNTLSFYQSFFKPPERKSNLIIITTILDMDNLDLSKLLSFAERGNTVFISAAQMSQNILDSFNISLKMDRMPNPLSKDPLSLNLENKKVRSDTGFCFTKELYNSCFAYVGQSTMTILGTNWNGSPNFIIIPYGQGAFYLHTQPLTFTNYHLLYGNYQYASFVFSHLPVEPTFWDEYYKPNKPQAPSPLLVILSNKALKIAYSVLMISLLIYMFFMSKRRQRIIPVIKPPKNTSLEFLTTISNLYQYQSNYYDIATKKYRYWLDYIESRYHLRPGKNHEEFIHKLALKSGVDEKKIQKIFELFGILQSNAEKVNKELLFSFYDKVEGFYEEAN
ncbi:MAG: DUF4350 domain-containing protein [Bacteroidales bacterium]|nr:DUF4350 domain-containing protein [Bacteroidales bacterium]